LTPPFGPLKEDVTVEEPIARRDAAAAGNTLAPNTTDAASNAMAAGLRLTNVSPNSTLNLQFTDEQPAPIEPAHIRIDTLQPV
jgi:hypothetical protein